MAGIVASLLASSISTPPRRSFRPNSASVSRGLERSSRSSLLFSPPASQLGLSQRRRPSCVVVACLPPKPRSSPTIRTRLFVSGLSFRTSEESLRNAFEKFGRLVEVNLVMDRIANRPRGFAFLRYATEEESKKGIEGMHGKFLDGRVIFVEVAKPRSELHKQTPEQLR